MPIKARNGTIRVTFAIMRKPLISLALVAAQMLTWATGSLYACVSADGSACVDRGPQFCECCHGPQAEWAPHEAVHPKSCVDHGCHAAEMEFVHAWSAAPCGCQHQSMGEAAKAVTRGVKIAVDLSLRSSALSTCVKAPTASSRRAVFETAISAYVGSERDVSLRTAVLRC
jgi:hypothetical protein